MGDFGDFDDFQHDVQGRRIKIFKNGEFKESKGRSQSNMVRLSDCYGSTVRPGALDMG